MTILVGNFAMFDCFFRSDQARLRQDAAPEHRVLSSTRTESLLARLQRDKLLKCCIYDALCFDIIHTNYQIIAFLVAPHVLPDDIYLTCCQQWCVFLTAVNVMTAIMHGVVSFLLKNKHSVSADFSSSPLPIYARKYPFCYLGMVDVMVLSCIAVLVGLMTLAFSLARDNSAPSILFAVNYTLDLSLALLYFSSKKCWLSAKMRVELLQPVDNDEGHHPLRLA